MKVVVEYNTEDKIELSLGSNWSYEIRFGFDNRPHEATLLIVDPNAILLENQDMISFFNQVNNIDIPLITNIKIFDDEDTILFDAVDLEFTMKKVSLEYISSNESLSRPGVGMLFLFNFYNNYISD